MADKIDSNLTGLAYAEEETIGVLPVSPSWQELEPNSYSDLGGEISKVAREPINASRQRKKGTTTDVDASGGFNIDLTKSNLTKLFQGFLFADAHEKPDTKPFNGTEIPITSVTSGPNTYTAASGLDAFEVGSLVNASGFANSANNGLKRVTASASGVLTVAETLAAVASPASTARIETCGFQFDDGDLGITKTASQIILVTTTKDFTELGLNIGEWIYIGGEATANKFDTNSPGFGRVKSISTNSLVLDDTTFVATTEVASAGKEIQIFFGKYIRNEKDSNLIKRRTYNIERSLGQDDNGTQSEYLEGSVPNDLSLNIPTTDKVNVDLSFVAKNSVQRTGTEGLKSGTRLSAPGEDPFNTSSDIYRLKVSVVDPDSVNADPLFGFVSEASISISNGADPLKAIGTLGSFEINVGDFAVSGSLTAYFSTVAAVQAVRNNCDVAFNCIAVNTNAAVVFDLPLIGLNGGRLNVEKDSPITIPLDQDAFECEEGYTMSTSWLPYVPIQDASC